MSPTKAFRVPKSPSHIISYVLIFLHLFITNIEGMPNKLHLLLPPTHTALSGDLHVQLSLPEVDLGQMELRLYRVEDGPEVSHLLYDLPVIKDARGNLTVLKLPCGLFGKGGEYYVELVELKGNGSEDSKISKGLDVRWPMPRLSLTPERIQTYPESPVTAILEFPEVVCPPVRDSAPSAIPEFWLELHYCGHSLLTCDNQNTSNVQVLYSEQIRGFPGKRMLTLRCELFGLAGHYALVLRPTTPMPSLSNTAAYVKADWSEQFVFNVHARSIMPCDPHSGGVTVLFQYPSCILSTGDRVRVYSRLRADVASLSPPTSMEYVAEQRVTRGQHSLHFQCDLFSERYVEYCFVYVSQAITGAVADVRMDCVPTLPVSESESGGWGSWSPWTPCSTTCAGGTRSRYRFCDSPPPRYGAKFCQGPAVETEKCENPSATTDWDCLYGAGAMSGSGLELPADRPEILAEVGPGCRCGCVVHLGEAKPRRLLATSSQSCPGRTFWLIQADPEYQVRFKVDHFRLPCGSQWLKIRDGSSLSAQLLALLEGSATDSGTKPKAVQSTGQYLLLEFFSDELLAGGESCGGGFLAHAMQIRTQSANGTVIIPPVAQGAGLVATIPAAAVKLTAVHIAALLLVSFVLIATALLGAQYILRYRKYHIAEDMDSLQDVSDSGSGVALRARASSSATLLSEVISLTRLRPPGRATRHTRLRESMDCEQHTSSTTDLCSEHTGIVHNETASNFGSTATLTPPVNEAAELVSSTPSPGAPEDVSVPSDVSPDSESKDNSVDRLTVSNPALTKGCYSPAASIVSTATIRSTNPKESKEKRNREKLLKGPGSEFSLANTEIDMEIDYYDYNVTNASAVPGSYLGMDPQYLIWIPPLDDSEIDDIKPKQYIDPGSNQESPEEEIFPKLRRKSISEITTIEKSLLVDNQQKESEKNKCFEKTKSLIDLIKAEQNSAQYIENLPVEGEYTKTGTLKANEQNMKLLHQYSKPSNEGPDQKPPLKQTVYTSEIKNNEDLSKVTDQNLKNGQKSDLSKVGLHLNTSSIGDHKYISEDQNLKKLVGQYPKSSGDPIFKDSNLMSGSCKQISNDQNLKNFSQKIGISKRIGQYMHPGKSDQLKEESNESNNKNKEQLPKDQNLKSENQKIGVSKTVGKHPKLGDFPSKTSSSKLEDSSKGQNLKTQNQQSALSKMVGQYIKSEETASKSGNPKLEQHSLKSSDPKDVPREKYLKAQNQPPKMLDQYVKPGESSKISDSKVGENSSREQNLKTQNQKPSLSKLVGLCKKPEDDSSKSDHREQLRSGSSRVTKEQNLSQNKNKEESKSSEVKLNPKTSDLKIANPNILKISGQSSRSQEIPKSSYHLSKSKESVSSDQKSSQDIQMDEFPKNLGVNSPARVHKVLEKETDVSKSLEDLDDIKFADDEEGEVTMCNKTSYQTENMINRDS